VRISPAKVSSDVEPFLEYFVETCLNLRPNVTKAHDQVEVGAKCLTLVCLAA
jgi:hypothetical protein